MHPDVQDATGLSVYDIVYRVQCEAAEKIRLVYAERSYYSQIEALKTLDKDIKAAGEAYNKALAPIVAEFGVDFDKGGLEIKEAIYTTDLQIQQLIARIEKLQAKPPEPGDDALAAAFKVEGQHLIAQRTRINSALNSVTDLQKKKETLENLLKNRAQYDEFDRFATTSMLFQFDLTIVEHDNFASDNSMTWPTPWGTINITTTNSKYNKQRTGARTVQLTTVMAKLVDFCVGEESVPPARNAHRYPIAGVIGVADLIDSYRNIDGMHQKAKEDAKYFQDSIEFVTDIQGVINPKVTLAKKSVASWTFGQQADLGRKDTHKVTIAFSPPADPKAGGGASTQELVIRRIPEVRTRRIGAFLLD